MLHGVEGIGFMHFTEEDVVRHPLVQSIIRAYDRKGPRRNSRRHAAPRSEAPAEDPAEEAEAPEAE